MMMVMMIRYIMGVLDDPLAASLASWNDAFTCDA